MRNYSEQEYGCLQVCTLKLIHRQPSIVKEMLTEKQSMYKYLCHNDSTPKIHGIIHKPVCIH